MQRRVRVVFDGKVLRPEEPLGLQPDGHYIVTIEDDQPSGEEKRPPGMLDDILDLAQDLDLPPDFAEQHDHYLYGTPKR